MNLNTHKHQLHQSIICYRDKVHMLKHDKSELEDKLSNAHTTERLPTINGIANVIHRHSITNQNYG